MLLHYFWLSFWTKGESWCLQVCGTCDWMQGRTLEIEQNNEISDKDGRRGMGAWGVLGSSSGNHLGWNNLTLPSPPQCHVPCHNNYINFRTPSGCQLGHFPRKFIPTNSFFLMSKLNLPWHISMLFPLVLSFFTWEKRLTHTLLPLSGRCREEPDIPWS